MMLQIQEFVKAPNHRKPKIIGVCPARGGSTRLPDKNMRLFAGRPLIAWTILQALGSHSLDEFWVTSDDDQILELADKMGAKTHKREQESPDTPGWVPYNKILDIIAQPDDIFVGMFATNPIRMPHDIDAAVAKWVASPNHEEKFLVAVERVHEDFRWQIMNDDLAVPAPVSENEMCRYAAIIQVCTPAYYKRLTEQAEDAYYIPYFIEPWQGIDTDTMEQLRFAELVFYDRILREGLDPYSVYKKGGIKL
jgi:CMP-N-acetylneuraminic acid synthetase